MYFNLIAKREQILIVMLIAELLKRKPKGIIFSFDYDQGKYIKTLPLHHSQEILIDDDKEFRNKLLQVATYEFKCEVLSYGNRVKIISPESFKNRMKAEVEDMLKNFN